MRPEDIIKSIPEEEDYEKNRGNIKIRFMRMSPTFKVLDKNIPLSFIFENLYLLEKESDKCGICISIKEDNLKINNYYLFVKSVFKNQKVEIIDHQRNSVAGMPDFEIKLEDNSIFYIEYKSKNDSIRPTQLEWIGKNLDKEVWFLIMENIECLVESFEFRNQRHKIFKENGLVANQVSDNIMNQLNDKLQNIDSKITTNNNKNGK